MAAAVEAARALPFRFVLVGRAENFLHGRPDLDDTIHRLQAFEAVGADVLFPPGTVADLAALGVRRISVGSALSRAALGAFVRAAREIREHGTFRFAEDALPYADANDSVVR